MIINMIDKMFNVTRKEIYIVKAVDHSTGEEEIMFATNSKKNARDYVDLVGGIGGNEKLSCMVESAEYIVYGDEQSNDKL